MSTTTISIPRGNDMSSTVTVSSGGVAQDITGWTIFCTVKRDVNEPDDTDALISKTVTVHTNPSGGISSISFTHDDTDIAPNIYKYDIKIKDTSGNLRSSTVGNFVIEDRVTVRES